MTAPTDADRILAGECLHGHPEQCLECKIVRVQIITLRNVCKRRPVR